MPPEDPTPLGDAMTHRFPDQKIPKASPEVPTPEPTPPTGDGDAEGGGKPKAPPADDEPGRRVVPVELPGREHAPERASKDS